MPIAIQPLNIRRTPGQTDNIRRIDIINTLNGLEGHYLSRDLYNRYLSVCHEADWPPVSPSRFGRTMARLNFDSWRTATGRGWTIPATWIII